MSYLLLLIILLGSDAALLWYLVNSEYFSPRTLSGDVEIWNVLLFLFLVSAAAGLMLSVAVYLGEKFLYCGAREFPSPARSVKYGLIIFLTLNVLLLLHVFHFLNFFVAIILIAFVVIGIIWIR